MTVAGVTQEELDRMWAVFGQYPTTEEMTAMRLARYVEAKVKRQAADAIAMQDARIAELETTLRHAVIGSGM